MLRNISISKRPNVDPNSTQPTYNIVASDDNYQNKVVVGGLWVKTNDQDGSKYQSGSLAKERTSKEGKFYDGYVIITQSEYRKLTSGEPKVEQGEVPPSEIGEISF